MLEKKLGNRRNGLKVKMTNRKKRLKKGIESLEKQIEIHKEKKRVAEERGDEFLEDYYAREIEAKIRDKERREGMLRKS